MVYLLSPGDCCGCDEDCACTGAIPDELSLTVPTQTSAGCGDCASLAGTYTLGNRYFVESSEECVGTCVWFYELDPPICGIEAIFYFINDSIDRAGLSLIPLGTVVPGLGDTGSAWSVTGSPPYDCAAWVNESLPVVQSSWVSGCSTGARNATLSTI